MPSTAALTLGDFVSAGGQSYKGGITKARLLRESGASAVVLVGTSFDGQLEAVWKDRHRFVEAVRDAGIDIVLGPAFSIYRGRPPLERLANRSRNLDVYQYLRDAGIEAIPAVGFIDEEEAAFVGGWVAGYGLQSIFVDLQSAGDPRIWEVVQEALRALIARARSVERIVINGVGQPDHVVELARLVEPAELVLTNASAFQFARIGLDYFPEKGGFVRLRTTTHPPTVFKALARFYKDASARRIDRYVPRSAQMSLNLGMSAKSLPDANVHQSSWAFDPTDRPARRRIRAR